MSVPSDEASTSTNLTEKQKTKTSSPSTRGRRSSTGQSTVSKTSKTDPAPPRSITSAHSNESSGAVNPQVLQGNLTPSTKKSSSEAPLPASSSNLNSSNPVDTTMATNNGKKSTTSKSKQIIALQASSPTSSPETVPTNPQILSESTASSTSSPAPQSKETDTKDLLDSLDEEETSKGNKKRKRSSTENIDQDSESMDPPPGLPPKKQFKKYDSNTHSTTSSSMTETETPKSSIQTETVSIPEKPSPTISSSPSIPILSSTISESQNTSPVKVKEKRGRKPGSTKKNLSNASPTSLSTKPTFSIVPYVVPLSTSKMDSEDIIPKTPIKSEQNQNQNGSSITTSIPNTPTSNTNLSTQKTPTSTDSSSTSVATSRPKRSPHASIALQESQLSAPLVSAQIGIPYSPPSFTQQPTAPPPKKPKTSYYIKKSTVNSALTKSTGSATSTSSTSTHSKDNPTSSSFVAVGSFGKSKSTPSSAPKPDVQYVPIPTPPSSTYYYPNGSQLSSSGYAQGRGSSPLFASRASGSPSTCANNGRVLIVDNGAYSVKFGFYSQNWNQVAAPTTLEPGLPASKSSHHSPANWIHTVRPSIFHNAVARGKTRKPMVGRELGPVSHITDESIAQYQSTLGEAFPVTAPSGVTLPTFEVCTDFRNIQLMRPLDRGYVINWDLQSQIWNLEYAFKRKFPLSQIVLGPKWPSVGSGGSISSSSAYSGVDSSIEGPLSHLLLLTEAVLSPSNLCQRRNEYVFEEAGFGSLFCASPAFLSMLYHKYVASYTPSSIWTSSVLVPPTKGKSPSLVNIEHPQPNKRLSLFKYKDSFDFSSSSESPHYNNSMFPSTTPTSFSGFDSSALFDSSTSSPYLIGGSLSVPLIDMSLNPCCLIVDIGYSFTHSIPFYGDYKINHAMRRLNVGGKILTNSLAEMVSYRHFNMWDQTYLMSLIKDQFCFVSQDMETDLRICKKGLNPGSNQSKGSLENLAASILSSPGRHPFRVGYVLPDQTNSRVGHVYDPKSAESTDADAQILWMQNERMSVPEGLFRPSDVGFEQGGIAELIAESINACPEALRPALMQNIVLVGGTAELPGLPQRLLQDLRTLLPIEYPITIYTPPQPSLTAWYGGHFLTNERPMFLDSMAVSRSAFAEHGTTLTKNKFSLF